MNRLLKDNVALIAVLEAADGVAGGGGPDAAGRGKQLICVANTHIHANPELNDVKLWQVCVYDVLQRTGACLGVFHCRFTPEKQVAKADRAAPTSSIH